MANKPQKMFCLADCEAEMQIQAEDHFFLSNGFFFLKLRVPDARKSYGTGILARPGRETPAAQSTMGLPSSRVIIHPGQRPGSPRGSSLKIYCRLRFRKEQRRKAARSKDTNRHVGESQKAPTLKVSDNFGRVLRQTRNTRRR